MMGKNLEMGALRLAGTGGGYSQNGLEQAAKPQF